MTGYLERTNQRAFVSYTHLLRTKLLCMNSKVFKEGNKSWGAVSFAKWDQKRVPTIYPPPRLCVCWEKWSESLSRTKGCWFPLRRPLLFALFQCTDDELSGRKGERIVSLLAIYMTVCTFIWSMWKDYYACTGKIWSTHLYRWRETRGSLVMQEVVHLTHSLALRIIVSMTWWMNAAEWIA